MKFHARFTVPVATIRYIFIISVLLISSLNSAAQEVVGATPAQFDVSGGQANYSIPIKVPPGRGGMQPELAISYSSSAGSGTMGKGFSLTGLSAITRCAATLPQDGFISGITFTAKDRYCLDGQRLIPVSGVNGGVGTEYKTESDTYSRIMSHGGSTNHPDHFTVKTKSGNKLIYGTGQRSALPFPKGVVKWNISFMNDTTDNNLVKYNYRTSFNTPLITSIIYPGGAVNIQYKRKDNYNYGYAHGVKIGAGDLISSITTRGSGPSYRSYSMLYNASLGDDFLYQIKECKYPESGICQPPINFTWEGVDLSSLNNSNIPDISYSHANNKIDTQDFSDSSKYTELIGDIEGDGVSDLIWLRSNANGLHAFSAKGKGDGTFHKVVGGKLRDGNFGSELTYGKHVRDVNADGIADFIWTSANNSGLHTYVALGKRDGTFQNATGRRLLGGNFDNNTYRTSLVDLNTDGLTDILWVRVTASSLYVYSAINKGDGSFSNATGGVQRTGNFKQRTASKHYIEGGSWVSELAMITPVFGDINNDGLMDITLIRLDNEGLIVHVSAGLGNGKFSNLNVSKILKRGLSGVYSLKSNDITLVDLNGDSLLDLLYESNHESTYLNQRTKWLNTHVFYGKGDGTFTEMISKQFRLGPDLSKKSDLKKYQRTIVDVNGDGYPDLTYLYKPLTPNKEMFLFTRIGTNESGAKNSFIKINIESGNNSNFDYTSKRHVADINGDGAPDLMWLHNGSDGLYVNSLINESKIQRHKLTSITDSYNNITEIQYKPLTDKTVYTKYADAQYPVLDLQYPLYVVSSVTATDGIDGTLSTEYKYEGLKTHLKDHGSHGFTKIIETHPDTGKTKETTFDQSVFPLAGNPYRVVEKYNGRVVNESLTTYAVNKRDNGTYQVYDSKTEQSSYELNGSLVTSVIATNSDIDEFGNVKSVKITTLDSSGNEYTKKTLSNYDNNISRWHLGRLRNATVVHSAPDTPAITRKSQFTYKPNTGLLWTENVLSSLTNQVLNVKRYEYDSYGQISQTHLSASGEKTRSSTTAYDPQQEYSKPKTVCNALNHCSTNTYYSSGLLKSTTGPNQITTEWLYDDFGRRKLETRADGTTTSIDRQFVTSNLCGQLANGAFSCTISQSSGSRETKIQYDSLGRELRKIRIGFDGREIYQDTEYNHLSQVERVSSPYFLGQNVYWAASQYDALGRVTTLTKPGPHGSTSITKTQYKGLTTTTTAGPKSLVKKSVTNAIGKVTHLDEEEGAYIDYTYYADGNLHTTKVSGVDATKITLIYDEFGRKKTLQDPDMGHWQYTYTPFGQLKTQTDAKGQVTTNTYDVLGRMQTRTEKEGVSTWKYYDNSASLGSRGKLETAFDAGIRKTFYYDSFGRPKSTTTKIGNQSYVTSTSYDELGRIERVNYPGSNNFHTENIYNGYGFLEKIRGARINTQSYDLEQLKPLIQRSMKIATDYQKKAEDLRKIGQAYKAKLAYYKSLGKTGNLSVDEDLKEQLRLHKQKLESLLSTDGGDSP